MMGDKAHILDTLSREELGIDPKELGGSPWVAAITSFFLFSGGAIIPLFPYIFLHGTPAMVISLALGRIGALPDRGGHHPADRQKRVGFRFPAGFDRPGRSRAGFRVGKLIGVSSADKELPIGSQVQIFCRTLVPSR